MKIHCRFTPYDISGYLFTTLEWIADKMLVAYEDKKKDGTPTDPHFHIYIESKPDIGDDTIRNKIKKALCIPTGGQGKNNKYYSINWKWQDPSYICKYDDIRVIVGYTEQEVLSLAVEGKKKYLSNGEVAATNTVVLKGNSKERINYDKEIIADLLTWYYQYKKDNDNEIPDTKLLINQACIIVRKYHRGINIFKVRDYVHSVMFDTDYSLEVIKTIYKLI